MINYQGSGDGGGCKKGGGVVLMCFFCMGSFILLIKYNIKRVIFKFFQVFRFDVNIKVENG